MKTVIYYFTGTGNSLAIARDLAELIEGECALLPVPAYMNDEKVVVRADAVGFSFPVYAGDMPYAVRKLINRMEFVGTPYIFGVVTYGGAVRDSNAFLADIMRKKGQTLSAFYSVLMPGNSLLEPEEKIKAELAAQKGNSAEIGNKINARFTEDYSGLVPPESSMQWETGNARGMTADETCNGCGKCMEICPMSNIKMENGRPVFEEDCISCMACFHWCPIESIFLSKMEKIMRRPKYHHPDVTIDDIIAMTEKV